MSKKQTIEKLLDAAELLTQTVGLNAFSYKHLAAQVGIKTASIHYHFPSKHDLIVALVGRYIERFVELLETIDATQGSGLKRLQAFCRIFVETYENNKMCPCAMLASELMSVNQSTHDKLKYFFQVTEQWLSKTLQLAVTQGEVSKRLDPSNASKHLLATLEGGMLIARAKSDVDYFKRLIALHMELITKA